MEVLGIDIGGSGIKGAIVNTKTGQLISDRFRVPTPDPSTPKRIAQTVHLLINHFNWTGKVGCSFPTVIKNGKSYTSGNIHAQWVGVQIDDLFSTECNGIPFVIGNDADLAGIAEIKLGAGKGLNGKVIMVTIGTGLGTGIFYNGQLIPNFELGRIYHTDGRLIEFFAGNAARKQEGLTLKKWAKRFDIFLNHVARVCAPDHFIVGGGLSKKYDQFNDYLTVDVPVTPAKFRNNAGIIGAAVVGSL